MTDLLTELKRAKELGYEFEEVYIQATYMTDIACNIIKKYPTFEVDGKHYRTPDILTLENQITDMKVGEFNLRLEPHDNLWCYDIMGYNYNRFWTDLVSACDKDRLTACMHMWNEVKEMENV